jgi:hypothetical protein
MREIESLLVDARAQVRAALSAAETETPFALKPEFSLGESQGNVVTWGEYSNVSTDCPVVDRIVFQVEVYALDRDSRQELGQAVNQAMTALGLKRVYASPDSFQDTGPGYFCKTFRFARKVDKRTMRLID